MLLLYIPVQNGKFNNTSGFQIYYVANRRGYWYNPKYTIKEYHYTQWQCPNECNESSIESQEKLNVDWGRSFHTFRGFLTVEILKIHHKLVYGISKIFFRFF